jgi:hypothetical protein
LLVRKKLSKTPFGFCDESLSFYEFISWKLVVVILIVVVIIVAILFDGRQDSYCIKGSWQFFARLVLTRRVECTESEW